MGSLFAGPRTGFTAYTEKDIRVGVTFYIAFLVEGRKVKERGIVEIVGVDGDQVVSADTKDNTSLWACTIDEFLETANLYTDMNGNPFYKKLRKWWQIWR
jgi:hypothetical protein